MIDSRWGLYEAVEVEVEGEAVDENSKMLIVAVRGSYTDVVVQEVLEIQNLTLRGA